MYCLNQSRIFCRRCDDRVLHGCGRLLHDLGGCRLLGFPCRNSRDKPGTQSTHIGISIFQEVRLDEEAAVVETSPGASYAALQVNTVLGTLMGDAEAQSIYSTGQVQWLHGRIAGHLLRKAAARSLGRVRICCSSASYCSPTCQRGSTPVHPLVA